ncbi:MAG TPA: serine hydrolase [Candidatus Eisenbacteria bacterium]|nr:serine hydrolase [Candidatus Eisenbacteria bacterium]
MRLAGRTPPLPPPLDRVVATHEQRLGRTLAVWVHDLRRRETFGLRAEEPFDPASTIALFVLLELFRQAETGVLALGEEVELRERDMVDGPGVLKDLTPGLRLSLRDTATLMITVSDGVAANLLIRRLGAGSINRGARAAGAVRTRLAGRMLGRRQGQSFSTVRDLGALLAMMARRTAVSPAASRAMLDILGRERRDGVVGRLLPDVDAAGRPLRRAWRVASMNGSIAGVRNCVALVRGSGLSYVVALMSRGPRDLPRSSDHEATLCLARVARAVHDHVAAAGGASQSREAPSARSV